jgi:3-methyladenine DNA glycosylase AlkD
VLRSSAVLIRRDERFAKTAVGWILRDLSKYDPETVAAFVRENLPYFSTESIRNALKYSPEAVRRTFVTSLNAGRQRDAADISARHRRRIR